MGLIYKDTGLFQEALDEYKLAIQYGPSDCTAKENLAVVLTVCKGVIGAVGRLRISDVI